MAHRITKEDTGYRVEIFDFSSTSVYECLVDDPKYALAIDNAFNAGRRYEEKQIVT